MFPSKLSFLAIALLAFVQLCSVTAIPAPILDERARDILARSTPGPPVFVAYSDKWTGSDSPPATSAISGFNV